MSEPFERAWARSVRRDAESVERVGDRIGPNRTDLANRAYRMAGDLREWAREIEARIPLEPEPS
jgi:hypothetical protein